MRSTSGCTRTHHREVSVSKVVGFLAGLATTLLALPVLAQSRTATSDETLPAAEFSKTTATQISSLIHPLTEHDSFYRLRTRSNYLNLERMEKNGGRRYQDLLSFELFLAQHQRWSLHVGPSAEVNNFRNRSGLKSDQNLDLLLGSQVGGSYKLSNNIALNADVLQMKYHVIESTSWPVQFSSLHDEKRFVATIDYKF